MRIVKTAGGVEEGNKMTLIEVLAVAAGVAVISGLLVERRARSRPAPQPVPVPVEVETKPRPR